MNDEIRRMLIQGYKSVNSKSLEKETKELSRIADENIDNVFKHVIEDLLKEYQEHPLNPYFQINFMYSDYYFGKIPGVTFEHSLDELAKTYRDAYSKDLHFAISGPFKLSALKKKLEEEGIYYRQGIGSSLDIILSADEFKELINRLIDEDNQKHH